MERTSTRRTEPLVPDLVDEPALDGQSISAILYRAAQSLMAGIVAGLTEGPTIEAAYTTGPAREVSEDDKSRRIDQG